MKRLLKRALGYDVVPNSGKGSHEYLENPDGRRIRWAYHDKRELSPIEVRNILVKQAGLTLEEAREVFRNG
jgi:predicted RNA binding protein YcfA (HicA-like mRNA interferase family)